MNVQRVACVRLDHDAVGHDLGARGVAKAAGAQHGARRQADEAVAPEALAADDGFEQEAVLGARPAVAASLRYSDSGVSRSAKASPHQGMRL
jgi:hypothetical protein